MTKSRICKSTFWLYINGISSWKAVYNYTHPLFLSSCNSISLKLFAYHQRVIICAYQIKYFSIHVCVHFIASISSIKECIRIFIPPELPLSVDIKRLWQYNSMYIISLFKYNGHICWPSYEFLMIRRENSNSDQTSRKVRSTESACHSDWMRFGEWKPLVNNAKRVLMKRVQCIT